MSAAARCGSASGSWVKLGDNLLRRNVGNYNNKKGFRVSCVSSAAVSDPYKTLRIHRGASQSEVKKAFRQLALQYHPDVCRGCNSEVQFHQINEAYDIVMSNLRDEASTRKMEMWENYDAVDEGTYEDGELWEEWMGWEGAGIRDYSSHINPYI